MKKSRERSGKMPAVLIVILAVVALAAILIGRYFYSNLHYDAALMRKVEKSGFIEKHANLSDGTTINYGEGPDNGPAVLLIHGQTVAWEDYDTVLPGLAKDYHVFAVDCFGHGGSDRGKALYSCEVNGRALAEFIESVIGTGCYVSGHSSGGILAAWLGANAPEQVKGLLLEDPPFFSVTPEEVTEGKGAFAWFETYRIAHSFMNQDETDDYSLYYLKNSYILSLFGGLRETIYKSALRARQKNPDEPIRLSWVPAKWLRPLLYMDNYDPAFGDSFFNGSWMQGIDQEKLLEQIGCPTVYLKAITSFGTDGVLYAANTDQDAQKLTSLIAGCEKIEIKSGHDIHYEHPEEFISALKKLAAISK